MSDLIKDLESVEFGLHQDSNDLDGQIVRKAIERIRELEEYGWRWTSNELPELNDKYMCVTDTGYEGIFWFNSGRWFHGQRPVNVIQWLKAPKPLKKDGDNA